VKRTSIWVCLMMVVVVLLSQGASASGNVLIGVVNVDLVIEQSQAGQLANNDLMALITSWQSQLDELEATILEMQEQLGEGASTPELDELVGRYQTMAVEAEYAIQQRADELYQLLLQDIAAVVNLVGARDGYTMIAEASSIFYYEAQVDVTSEIIREYDRLLNE